MESKSSLYGKREPLRKKLCALALNVRALRVGSLSVSPGGNSGLLSRGVMGPMEGLIASVLLANLSMVRVVPMRGCVLYSLGVDAIPIHGTFLIGKLAKESSIEIQSFEEW